MTDLVVINGQNVEFEVANDQVTTTSFQIATVFNKRHGDIIRKIELMPDDEFRQRNFALSQKPLQNGLFEKDTKYYKITRDGFVMLAMGFTGDKAYRFKVAYINAFNQALEKLKTQKPLILQSESESLKDELINTQKELINALKSLQNVRAEPQASRQPKTAKLSDETIRQIISLRAQGLERKKIAYALRISPSSVNKYLRSAR